MDLSNIELKILQYLKLKDGEAMKVDIQNDLNLIDEQSFKNTLRKLRNRELIYITPIGNLRYYSLTPIGEQIII